MSVRLSAASVCGTVAFLTGCGGADTGNHGASDCKPLTSSAPVTSTSKPTETALLTNVTVDSNACGDRVVFAFKSIPGTPGYRASYLAADKALVEDGSGSPVEVKGTTYLVVRFEPAATADISSEDLVRTYTGPRRITAPEDAHAVRELVKSGDFEAVLTWVIGLESRRAYDVSVSGSRVVVEIG